ncbi:MFS transporter [Paraconexibacter antarcticus]|uniref:MFS transporter n=1 Tax=Paraconexibacter antarcticus TaxID=2949664 RepID=A0ABY5DW27_9ACTN|nr:MFS transporter [Paraconexibacter antarcticus]UTI65129.1 MFS transporter [Paraconexibacter antarcticus]
MPAAAHAPRAGVVLLVVTLAQILATATALVVAVAVPPLGRDFHASATALQWVIDVYVLVVASLLVAGGAAGDRLGRKDAFLTGLGCFALGSLACALAPSIGLLLAGRVLQALGPVLVLPASLAIVSDVFPDPRERARAIGLWGAGSGIGLASGPTFGGAIVDAVGWRGVFAVNLPICAVLALLGWRTIPRRRLAPPSHRFDAAGAALLTAGVAALAFLIIEGRRRGWTSAVIVAAGVVAAGALAAFVAQERRHPAPMVDPTLLRTRAFVVANVSGAVVFFTFTGVIVFMAAFLQQVRGETPGATGLYLLPFGASVALCAPVAGRLTGRLGPRLPILSGLTLACAATVLLRARLDVSLAAGDLWWTFALLGAGVGLSLPPMTVTAVTAVDLARTGMASAVHNASRQLGQTLGVAVIGAIVLGRAGRAADGGRRLRGADAVAWTAGLHAALVVCAVLLGLALAGVAALVPRGRPAPPAG